MKVAIIYPPMKQGKKNPLLSQNRQFRYSSSDEVKIFPLIPASAATILKQAGYEVFWLDGINQRITEGHFLEQLYSFDPEYVVLETKAPVIDRHWSFIDKIKKEKGIKAILVGDHVSFCPEESFQHSSVDYVITGGDYDVSLFKLLDYLNNGPGAMPKGIYFRSEGKILNTGKSELVNNLDELPLIDRELTRWDIYGEAYLNKPCAYILTGRGCGGNSNGPGRCSFCIWQHQLWNFTRRLRSPKNVVAEIKKLVEHYRVKEIFDDNESGAIWNKEWLREFYERLKKEDLVGRVAISTNARADSLDDEACDLMSKVGFRLLKVGIESVNDRTLQELNKNETSEYIIRGVKKAKDYGLKVLMTFMVGYPWETEDDVRRTFEAAKKLLLYKTHLGDSLQASVVIPYPGTTLHKKAVEQRWFLGDPYDYTQFDMSKPVLKSSIDSMAWCDRMWNLHKHPVFVVKTALKIRSLNDVKLLFRGAMSLLGHRKDF